MQDLRVMGDIAMTMCNGGLSESLNVKTNRGDSKELSFTKIMRLITKRPTLTHMQDLEEQLRSNVQMALDVYTGFAFNKPPTFADWLISSPSGRKYLTPILKILEQKYEKE